MIGVMGGTFDPIHYGHLRTALEAAEALSLSKVLFIPTHTPLLKQQPHCTEQDRVMMLKLALEDIALFELDQREIARQGRSYTIDTLTALATDYPNEQFVFLLGADAFARFQQWKNWQCIMELVHLVVLYRPEYSLKACRANTIGTGTWTNDLTVLQNTPSGCIFPLAVTQLSISSTFIRQRLAEQKTARFLLPDKVLNYINQHKLYHLYSFSDK